VLIDKPSDELSEALPDGAIVIRGGRMDPRRLLRRAARDRERLGRFGISGFGATSAKMTLEELIRRAGMPHPELQRSTVGRIREAGFKIERTGRWPHCTIDLGEAPDEETTARLIAAFDPPEPTGGPRDPH
jgi:hypothetical protein